MPQGIAIRKHPCTVCGRSYGKSEHLLRHQRSHTGAKPFSCKTCEQRFSRQDSLSRHWQRTGHDRGARAGTPHLESHQAFNSSHDGTTIFLNTTSDVVRGELTTSTTAPALGFDNEFQQMAANDAEELLQYILNNDFEVFPEDDIPSLQLPTVPISHVGGRGANVQHLQAADRGSKETNDAIQHVSQIIAEMSTNAASDAAATNGCLTASFLDDCLHLFFEQFMPTFPVCHRPTFCYKDWTPPLILNAIALGALFLGEDRYVAQANALWRLAHTAVATSWHALILHRAPNDRVNGVQLVTTALLGQTYAMLSSDRKLRMTAHVFHSLGFYWARECRMYNIERGSQDDSASTTAEYPLVIKWQRWVMNEVQLRVLLGHYILDSQLTHFMSAPTTQRHASNALPLPCSDALFEAPSPAEWSVLMAQYQIPATLTFRELFLRLYRASAGTTSLPAELPSLAISVLLEGLRSILLEADDADGPVLGQPSTLATSQALGVLYTYLTSSHHLSTGQHVSLILRWHAVCIDAVRNSVSLCLGLCSQCGVEQNLFVEGRPAKQPFSAQAWVASPEARKSLLHATAVYEGLGQLPLKHANAAHIPISVFTAAIVYCAFLIGGISSVNVPQHVVWSLLIEIDTTLTFDAQSATVDGSALEEYIFVGRLPTRTTFRNLSQELSVLLLRLRQIARPWGLSGLLEQLLQQVLTWNKP